MNGEQPRYQFLKKKNTPMGYLKSMAVVHLVRYCGWTKYAVHRVLDMDKKNVKSSLMRNWDRFSIKGREGQDDK